MRPGSLNVELPKRANEGAGILEFSNSFTSRVGALEGANGLIARGIETIQVNVGLTCNLECAHCHVASSPRRKEQMEWKTMEHVLRVVRDLRVPKVDITGGAPEINPHFREFIRALRNEDISVTVRTNLTILLEPEFTDLPAFYRDNRVHLIASLPCYQEENVDAQRGEGVFQDSIVVLRILNSVGYGKEDHLILDLIYNPIGPYLPKSQVRLEEEYRQELRNRFGISFSRLYTIANMPIGQFRGDLKRKGKYEEYLQLLRESFSPKTVEGLMCRHQISVGWDGTLFDCDFNLALRLPLFKGAPKHISEFKPEVHARRRIATGEHCWGCAAGAGSSCGGALVAEESTVPAYAVTE